MTEEEMRKIELGRKMKDLVQNKDFNNLIMGDWNMEALRLILEEDLDSPKVIDKLKARQVFHQYIYGIINEAEILLDQIRKENNE